MGPQGAPLSPGDFEKGTVWGSLGKCHRCHRCLLVLSFEGTVREPGLGQAAITPLTCLISCRKTITALAFSPDGKYLVTGEVSEERGLQFSEEGRWPGLSTELQS